MKNTDFTKILKKEHQNKWVALSPNHTKVIAYSSKLLALEKKVVGKKVVYVKVPPTGVVFAF